MPLRLSIVDVSPVPPGGTRHGSLRSSIAPVHVMYENLARGDLRQPSWRT